MAKAAIGCSERPRPHTAGGLAGRNVVVETNDRALQDLGIGQWSSGFAVLSRRRT